MSSCGRCLCINPVNLCAGLGLCAWWAPLLAVVTLSCAAGPDRWQCGRPAWATTCGVKLRSKGAQVSTCPADAATPEPITPDCRVWDLPSSTKCLGLGWCC